MPMKLPINLGIGVSEICGMQGFDAVEGSFVGGSCASTRALTRTRECAGTGRRRWWGAGPMPSEV